MRCSTHGLFFIEPGPSRPVDNQPHQWYTLYQALRDIFGSGARKKDEIRGRMPQSRLFGNRPRRFTIEPDAASPLPAQAGGEESTTLRISGEIVGPKIVRLSRTVEELIESPCRTVTVDLRDVPYIDSYGLGGLVYCHKQLQQANKRLSILVNKGLYDLFLKCKLENVLHLVPEDPSENSRS
mgnify:FL=1